MLAALTKLNVISHPNRKRYILDMYLRSIYLYNAILINNTEENKKIDAEVNKRLFRIVLSSKERGINNKALLRLEDLFQIITIEHKLEMDIRSSISNMKQ